MEGCPFVIEVIKTVLGEGYFSIVDCILEHVRKKGRYEEVERLWKEKHGDLNIWIDLLKSVRRGSLGKVGNILAKFKEDKTEQMQLILNFSLYIAAKYGQAQMVIKLLEVGANACYKNNLGLMPICVSYGKIREILWDVSGLEVAPIPTDMF